MDSSSGSKQKEIIDEVYGFIKVYSDGTVERPPFPGGYLPACPEFVQGVASKDVTIDAKLGLWARLFLPQSVTSSARKCPIVLHFHGGGLCSGTPSAASFHRFCSKMAVESESIWVSVDYRLAPEHRLPAAYDDAHAAFMWLCAQLEMPASCAPDQGPHTNCADIDKLHTFDAHEEVAKGSDGCRTNSRADNLQTCSAHEKAAIHGSHGHDTNGFFVEGHINTNNLRHGSNNSPHTHTPEPWLHRHADFSKCFLAGESSGGAIVHYLTMRIAKYRDSRIQVQGLLIIHAAFLIQGVYDVSYDPRFERRPDTYRLLCLPAGGAAWDHPLVNPLHADAPSINGITLPPSIVVVADQDKFCAPGKYYAHAMKQCGHVVELHVTEGQGHCFYLYRPKSKETELLFKHLVAFMHQQCEFQGCKSSL